MTRRGTLIPGAILVLLGLYFLAVQLNIRLPAIAFSQLWPAFIILSGLSVLGEYAFGERRDAGRLFPGVLLLLVGAFFFFFTLHLPLPFPPFQDGVTWADMRLLWPVFILIVGLAFLAQWLARPGNHGARNVSLVTLLVGLIALAVNFSVNDLFRQVVRLWPLLLVAAGAQMLVGYFRRGRRNSQ